MLISVIVLYTYREVIIYISLFSLFSYSKKRKEREKKKKRKRKRKEKKNINILWKLIPSKIMCIYYAIFSRVARESSDRFLSRQNYCSIVINSKVARVYSD